MNNFKLELRSQLDGVLAFGQDNAELVANGFMEEATVVSDEIVERVGKEFDDSYGEAELMGTARQSTLIFAQLMASYKTDFESAGDKDEVDAKEAALTKNLRNNYSYRLQLLNDIVAVHGMEDV